jgi:hypothetical protein
MIRLRQRSLTNYQYRYENPDTWHILPPDEEELAYITTLQLLLRNVDDYEHAITLLEVTPSLSSLDIQMHQLNVAPQPSEFPRLRRGPRSLRSLPMENVCLASGSSTISGLVELEELGELQLIDCEEYTCLSEDMEILPLKLKAFCIHEIAETTELFNSVENDFLRSLKPLVRLSLTLGSHFDVPSSLLDWSALHAHASTLQYIRVEYTWPELQFSEFHSGFSQFCKASLNLELLSTSGVTVGDGDDDIVHFLVRNRMNAVTKNSETDSFIGMHR